MANVSSPQHNDDSPVLFVDFNQDHSSLVVGTQYGYSLFNTTTDKMDEFFSKSGEKTCMVGRLFSSSLVTLVSSNDTRKLLVYHFRRDTHICHYRYSQTILAVKMNRYRLIVCVEDGIYIHNIRDMELLHKVEETPPNRHGIVAFSGNCNNCFLAYPGSHRIGTVYIFDAFKFKNVTSIPAHDGLLAALAFNSNGDLLATASEKGTVIRVFTIPSGTKVAEFRRGLARCAVISSLSFSNDSQFLVSASNTETVHVFKLDWKRSEECSGADVPSCGTGAVGPVLPDPSPLPGSAISRNAHPDLDECCMEPGATPAPPSSASWLIDCLGTALRASAHYLPANMSEVFTQDRAFSFAHLPVPANQKKVAALVYIEKQIRLLVASQDGRLYVFAIDPINGGEASLIKTHDLISSSESDNSSAPSTLTVDNIDSPPNTGEFQSTGNEDRDDQLRLQDDNEFPTISSLSKTH